MSYLEWFLEYATTDRDVVVINLSDEYGEGYLNGHGFGDLQTTSGWHYHGVGYGIYGAATGGGTGIGIEQNLDT